MINIPKLYVGTMNDAFFIIDQKPRPSPVDFVADIATNEIEICIPCEQEEELAHKLVDSWNAIREAVKG